MSARLLTQQNESLYWAAWLANDTAFIRGFAEQWEAEWYSQQMKFSDAHKIGANVRPVPCAVITKVLQDLWSPVSVVVVSGGNGWSTNLPARS